MGAQGSNQHATRTPIGTAVDMAPGTVVERPGGLRVVVGGDVYVVDVKGDHVVHPDTEDRHTLRAD